MNHMRSEIEQQIAKHEAWLSRLKLCDQRVMDFPYHPKMTRLHRRIESHERKLSAELEDLRRKLDGLHGGQQ
jgi:hypothetical protein